MEADWNGERQKQRLCEAGKPLAPKSETPLRQGVVSRAEPFGEASRLFDCTQPLPKERWLKKEFNGFKPYQLREGLHENRESVPDQGLFRR